MEELMRICTYDSYKRTVPDEKMMQMVEKGNSNGNLGAWAFGPLDGTDRA